MPVCVFFAFFFFFFFAFFLLFAFIVVVSLFLCFFFAFFLSFLFAKIFLYSNHQSGVMAIRPSLKVFNDMMNSTSLKTNHWAGDQGYQQNYWFFGCREGPVVSHLNLTKEHLKYPLHEDLSEEDSTVDTTPYFLNVSTWTGSYFVPRMEIPTLSDLPWPHPYGPKEFMTERFVVFFTFFLDNYLSYLFYFFFYLFIFFFFQ